MHAMHKGVNNLAIFTIARSHTTPLPCYCWLDACGEDIQLLLHLVCHDCRVWSSSPLLALLAASSSIELYSEAAGGRGFVRNKKETSAAVLLLSRSSRGKLSCFCFLPLLLICWKFSDDLAPNSSPDGRVMQQCCRPSALGSAHTCDGILIKKEGNALLSIIHKLWSISA